jgi:hypothetical protein
MRTGIRFARPCARARRAAASNSDTPFGPAVRWRSRWQQVAARRGVVSLPNFVAHASSLEGLDRARLAGMNRRPLPAALANRGIPLKPDPRAMIDAGMRSITALGSTPQIDASRDAVVHMEDSAPATNIGLDVMATPLRSMFQTDSVSLRLRWRISWALRASGACVDDSELRRCQQQI